jgi:hypothetical protein
MDTQTGRMFEAKEETVQAMAEKQPGRYIDISFLSKDEIVKLRAMKKKQRKRLLSKIGFIPFKHKSGYRKLVTSKELTPSMQAMLEKLI